jgi:DNA topoisomerase-3
MKTLVIAEKPSVARDLAQALGKIKKTGDWFENDEYVISSAVGHLVELVMPEELDKKWKSWRLETLPILPEKFELRPIEKTKSKFQELKKLLARKDIDQVINACDAGREGELIFTYIYDLAKCKKPVQRLWMSSMTKEGILKAFKDLRSSEQMAPLANAARCRSESDWLIGINATRAITRRMFGARSKQVATVGRVQTPTLAMVLERELAIRNFVPRAYWRIIARFAVANGEYEGVYQKQPFKKESEDDRADRIWNQEEADAILNATRNLGLARIEDEKKRTTQASPRLFDLTSLQREANNRFGMAARRTLSIAQDLYEKHKMITYPRTDSKALPEDYPQTCRDTMRALGDRWGAYTSKILENDWIKPGNKKIFNNAQVSDHFAIIPTAVEPKSLNADESKIFDLITRRFLAAFYPAAEFDVTTRWSRINEDIQFKTEGKILVKPGWLEVYNREAVAETKSDDQSEESGENNAKIPALSESDGQPPQSKVVEANKKEESTRPPARFTEATLLSAMETAGKLVDDEELAEAMKEKGLGTPATRAQIIEHLIALKYIDREGRELIATAKAQGLIEFLSALKAEELTSPSMTGDWESKLRKMELGEFSREQFMKEISDMTIRLVQKTKDFSEDDMESRETSVISPTDHLPLRETVRTYSSQDGVIRIFKIIGNRQISEEEIAILLRDKRVGPLDGFRSKAGKNYSAVLLLDDDYKVKFDFGPNGSGDENDQGAVDLSQYPVVGTCPLDGGKVYATPQAFLCENNQASEMPCTFRISRVLLKKEIPTEQFVKLLETGRTDLLERFISKRTGKPFSAILTLDKKGKLGFEFPPRPAKGAKPADKASSAETPAVPAS